MNGQRTSGVGEEGKRVITSSWGDGVSGEIIYVGRASFRVAREGDSVASPAGEEAVWLSPGLSSAPGSAPASESDGEASEPEMEVAPIAVEVGPSRRLPSWFKPSSWTLVIGPITAAFLLGMIVSPRGLSSPVRLATNPVMGRPSLVVQPEQPSLPVARVVEGSAPVIAPLAVAPASAVAPARLAVTLGAKAPAPIEAGTKVGSRRGRSKKVHAAGKDGPGRAFPGEADQPAGRGAPDIADAPVPKRAVKPWIDPWAD
jgi:hypothetical protein